MKAGGKKRINGEGENKSFRDLKVFQLSYNLSLEIFEVTKCFPREEKYYLTDRVRRSARSVSANIVVSWYRRRYPNSFLSKLVDSAAEAGETGIWTYPAADQGYLHKERKLHLSERYDQVNNRLDSMISQPGEFCH